MSIENQSKNRQTICSRRRFIQDSLLLGASIASGILTTGFVPYDSQGSDNSTKFTRIPEPTIEFLLDEEIVRNYFPNDKIIAGSRMGEQILHYKENPDLSNRIANSLKYRDLIYQCADKLNISHNNFVASSINGLIFVESAGDPKAVNKNSGAKGLCQITWDSAKGIYDKMPEEERKRLSLTLTKPDDLYEIKTNVILAMKILIDLTKTLPDPSLALWAFHFGQGSVYGAINTFVLGKEPVNIDAINLVEKYSLNFFKLVNDEKIREKLSLDKKNNLDDTEFYVPRIMAAKYFLME